MGRKKQQVEEIGNEGMEGKRKGEKNEVREKAERKWKGETEEKAGPEEI